MKIRFLPDEPICEISDDKLQSEGFARLVKSSLQDTRTPFVYGVLGDWGTGKTSILRLLDRMLNIEEVDGCQFVSIWFNAWKYENEANMVYPLLYAIKRRHDEAVFTDAEREGFKKSFLKVVAASALALTDLGLRALTKMATGEALKMEDVKKHLEAVEREADELHKVLAEWTDNVTKLEGLFQSLIDLFAQDYARANNISEDRIRFVILIDDLDRCLPDRALSVLESIKNFLAVQRCIFVLGLNPEAIYAGIQTKYEGANINGREYLEKILNYSFYVPQPEVKAIKHFGASKLTDLVVEAESQQKLSPYFEEFGVVLSECEFTNPRKIKRILNRYLLFLAKFEATLPRYIVSNVVKLHIMAEYFPEIFQLYLTGDTPGRKLDSIGEDDFKLDEFQRDTGLSLQSNFAQLKRMSKLFDLKKSLPEDNKWGIVQHAADVFSIARLK